MSDSILTRTYLQSAELQTLPPAEVVLPPGTWTRLCGPDPQRMTLTVIPGEWSRPPHVSPVDAGASAAAIADGHALPIQVHASVYPLLIGGQWWGLHRDGQTVTVIETRRLQGA